jgi:hypothetical protein
MSTEELEDIGPIDYIVIEWKGDPNGEVMPMILDLVDRNIIRILDIAFMTKAEDGTVAAIDFGDLKEFGEIFEAFEGASSGLLGFDDIAEAGAALEGGTSAAVLVWENRWAAPVASGLRRSGAQLVASGRLPVQAILGALETMEVTSN